MTLLQDDENHVYSYYLKIISLSKNLLLDLDVFGKLNNHIQSYQTLNHQRNY
jgi:hypothetical protein